MLQKNNNHFDIEELNILHIEKVANLIYRSYTEQNLIWNVLPSKREETKTAIIRRLHKCLNQNLSHVAVQNNRVVACVISIDLKNLEVLLQEEKQNTLPLIFQYLNKNTAGFYEHMLEYYQNHKSSKSAVMLFSAVEPEFEQQLIFLNLMQWNVEQVMLYGYKKYFGILSNTCRFMKLAKDKVILVSSCTITDKDYKEIDQYKLNLVQYELRPLFPRASL